MALKRHLYDNEQFGLTSEEVRMAEKYLRKHKTAGAVSEAESMKLFEVYMIGSSFHDIHVQFPQYSIPQIILTAALRGWPHDREKMMGSLRDRVQAKVVKSVIEQVDFLTSMLAVTNVEHLAEMQRYIEDPFNNPKPSMRVKDLKQYKDVVETLNKLVGAAAGSNNKAASMFSALTPAKKALNPAPSEEIDLAMLVEEEDNGS